MARIPPNACDCWRIVSSLRSDDQLPDHLCHDTMVATVERWAADFWGRCFYEAQSAALDMERVMAPAPSWAKELGRDLDMIIRLWPYPVYFDSAWADTRYLAAVIRQWAEEDPSATQAALLSGDRYRWPEAVELAQGLYEIDDRLSEPIDADVKAALTQRSLQALRLPVTPANVDHVMSIARGDSDMVLPARAMLVTSRLFVEQDPRYAGRVWRFTGTTDVQIGGALEFVTGPLLERVNAVVLRHRDWARKLARDALTEPSAIRKAQPGSFARDGAAETQTYDRLDYLAEALATTDMLAVQARRHPNGIEGAISEHIKAVYQRVRNRRIRANLLPTPPHGWSAEARRALRDKLSTPT